MARVFLSRILWLQGFPDQAMRAAESTVEDARAANDVSSLCYALALGACPAALYVGDLAAVEHYIRMLLDHAARHGLGLWHAWGRSFEGVLVIRRGDALKGLRLLRAGFDELGAANSHLRYITFLGTSARTLGSPRSGRRRNCHDRRGARSVQAHRRTLANCPVSAHQRGAASAAGRSRKRSDAEDHFRQALDWARRQGAVSWELRAATSLARLRIDQGRSADAMALLQPVYGRFTEGFETSDLKAAKALLDAFQ